MGKDPRYHGEVCPECGSDYSIIITTTPMDKKARPIPGKRRWQCQDCKAFFLANPR